MKKPQRIIAFDFGMKHIGAAVGNTLIGTAQALGRVRVQDGIPKDTQLQQWVQAYQPDLLVVGLPLTKEGEWYALSYAAQKFARRLSLAQKIPFEMLDERYTSAYARSIKADFPKVSKDALEAYVILMTWLYEHGYAQQMGQQDCF